MHPARLPVHPARRTLFGSTVSQETRVVRAVLVTGMDLASLALVGIFFALSWGFIVLCERL
jgi:hypothetical protein